jgi:hypothetical protein
MEMQTPQWRPLGVGASSAAGTIDLGAAKFSFKIDG